MPRLPVLPAHEILSALQRAGFVQVSQRGSHIKLRRETESGAITVIVPNDDEVPRGILASILRQARLTRDEFLALP